MSLYHLWNSCPIFVVPIFRKVILYYYIEVSLFFHFVETELWSQDSNYIVRVSLVNNLRVLCKGILQRRPFFFSTNEWQPLSGCCTIIRLIVLKKSFSSKNIRIHFLLNGLYFYRPQLPYSYFPFKAWKKKNHTPMVDLAFITLLLASSQFDTLLWPFVCRWRWHWLSSDLLWNYKNWYLLSF